MSGDVIDFPIVRRPAQQLAVHHIVTRKVDIEAVVDRKLRALSARAGCTPEQFIWGCVIEGLAEFEGIDAMTFIRKYLEP